MNNLSTPIAILLLFFFLFSVFAAEKIDVNTAPINDLVKIQHIGEARAEGLILLRPFSSIDDLIRIKGISEARIEDIKKQGLAWVDPHDLIISVGVDIQEKPEPEPESESKTQPDEEQQKESPLITYPSGILINEILPSPEGKDEFEEWLELKNTNNQEVDISGWKIQDTIGSTKTYTFPEGTKIKPTGYLILSRPVSKITLNNSGDGLQLIQPDGNILDNVSYDKATLGQSFNRFGTNWKWSLILTPNSVNVIPEPLKLKEDSPPLILEEDSPPPLSPLPLASLDSATQTSKPFSLLLFSFCLAIFSGIIILFLKKKLKNN